MVAISSLSGFVLLAFFFFLVKRDGTRGRLALLCLRRESNDRGYVGALRRPVQAGSQ